MAEWKIVNTEYDTVTERFLALHWMCRVGDAYRYGALRLSLAPDHPAATVAYGDADEALLLGWVADALGEEMAAIEAALAAEDAALAVPVRGQGRPWEQPSPEQQIKTKLEELAEARYERERGGVAWTDSHGETFYFDTSLASQQRIAAAALGAQKGLRRTTDVFKCGRLDARGRVSIVFRETTAGELNLIAERVHEHVQTCFNVEGVAARKVLDLVTRGDLPGAMAVDYAREYARAIAAR
jgi:hypothetical protein